MVSGDPVVKEALTVGVARKQAFTRKFSTIFECIGNFENIMLNGDPVVKEALTVGFARQAWTRKYSTIFVMSWYVVTLVSNKP